MIVSNIIKRLAPVIAIMGLGWGGWFCNCSNAEYGFESGCDEHNTRRESERI